MSSSVFSIIVFLRQSLSLHLKLMNSQDQVAVIHRDPLVFTILNYHYRRVQHCPSILDRYWGIQSQALKLFSGTPLHPLYPQCLSQVLPFLTAMNIHPCSYSLRNSELQAETTKDFSKVVVSTYIRTKGTDNMHRISHLQWLIFKKTRNSPLCSYEIIWVLNFPNISCCHFSCTQSN